MQIFAHLPSSFDGVQYSVYLQNNSCKSEYSFEFKNKKSHTYMVWETLWNFFYIISNVNPKRQSGSGESQNVSGILFSNLNL